MLIDKGLSTGDIITIKLTSGEELVAKLVEETDSFIKVSRPMVIGMGKEGPGLMPYLFTVDPDRTIKMYRSTITVLEPSDDTTSKQFIKLTTGIVT